MRKRQIGEVGDLFRAGDDLSGVRTHRQGPNIQCCAVAREILAQKDELAGRREESRAEKQWTDGNGGVTHVRIYSHQITGFAEIGIDGDVRKVCAAATAREPVEPEALVVP